MPEECVIGQDKKEEGTVAYAVCRDRKAIQTRSSAPHFKEFSKALKTLLKEKPDINIPEEIGSS